jgi:hypothetical protein
MIRTVSAIYVLLACSLLTVQAQQQQANNVVSPSAFDNGNVASIFQNMINYFNEHPFTDAANKPYQAFQNMIQQMQSADLSNANAPTNSAANDPVANIVLPAIPPSVANVVLSSTPPVTNNINAVAKNAPADIPIALAAGIPASVAAAAAIPPNQAATTTNNAPQKNAVIISGEPVVNQNPSVSAAVEPSAAAPIVVPEAPAVLPQVPNVVPEASAVAPSINPSVAEIAPISPSVASVESIIVNPSIEAATIVPVSTIIASESSALPPVQPSTTAPHSLATGTTMMSRTNAMSTATLSAIRSFSNSASISRSASPTITSTIPSISASNDLKQGNSITLSITLGFVIVIVTMISTI